MIVLILDSRKLGGRLSQVLLDVGTATVYTVPY